MLSILIELNRLLKTDVPAKLLRFDFERVGHGDEGGGDGGGQFGVFGFGFVDDGIGAVGDLLTAQAFALGFKFIFDFVGLKGLLGGNGGVHLGKGVGERVVREFDGEVDALGELFGGEYFAVIAPND